MVHLAYRWMLSYPVSRTFPKASFLLQRVASHAHQQNVAWLCVYASVRGWLRVEGVVGGGGLRQGPRKSKYWYRGTVPEQLGAKSYVSVFVSCVGGVNISTGIWTRITVGIHLYMATFF